MKLENNSFKQKIIISLLGPLILAIMSLGGYKIVVQATAEQVKKNCEKINELDKCQSILQAQIPEIKSSVDRIETSQNEFQKETRSDIKTILKELANLNHNHENGRRTD